MPLTTKEIAQIAMDVAKKHEKEQGRNPKPVDRKRRNGV
jgi:hypothetical protein